MSEVKWANTKANTVIDAFYIGSGATYQYLLIPPIQEGVDRNSRIGLNIQTKRFTMRYTIKLQQYASNPTDNLVCNVRVIFVQPILRETDWQFTDIFDSPATSGGYATNYLTNIQNKNFKVLYDRVHLLGVLPSCHLSQRQYQHYVKVSIPWKRNYTYKRDSSLYDANQSGDIYCFIITDASANNLFIVQFSWTVRMSFIDV